MAQNRIGFIRIGVMGVIVARHFAGACYRLMMIGGFPTSLYRRRSQI
jgi:hypothetical protein